MIEAVKFWNEPNNKSHWDFDNLDQGWRLFSEMVRLASHACQSENPALTRVLGGMSPIDPTFVQLLDSRGALDAIDAVAVHGFPLDWNPWTIHDWPHRVAEIEAVSGGRPVWVTEAGVSTFGAEEVQEFGLKRTAELLIGRVPRIHWYSLFDLPAAWPATTRHKEAEGSSYYRHFHLGLLREDGTPKLACKHFYEYAPEMGLCQWFHHEDPRLEDAVKWLRKLGVKRLRTGLSWADYCRSDGPQWLDRMMSALDEFDVTVTFCFTPEEFALAPDFDLPAHHTSPPRNIEMFADFCAAMVRRYAPGQTVHAQNGTSNGASNSVANSVSNNSQLS